MLGRVTNVARKMVPGVGSRSTIRTSVLSISQNVVHAPVEFRSIRRFCQAPKVPFVFELRPSERLKKGPGPSELVLGKPINQPKYSNVVIGRYKAKQGVLSSKHNADIIEDPKSYPDSQLLPKENLGEIDNGTLHQGALALAIEKVPNKQDRTYFVKPYSNNAIQRMLAAREVGGAFGLALLLGKSNNKALKTFIKLTPHNTLEVWRRYITGADFEAIRGNDICFNQEDMVTSFFLRSCVLGEADCNNPGNAVATNFKVDGDGYFSRIVEGSHVHIDMEFVYPNASIIGFMSKYRIEQSLSNRSVDPLYADGSWHWRQSRPGGNEEFFKRQMGSNNPYLYELYEQEDGDLDKLRCIELAPSVIRRFIQVIENGELDYLLTYGDEGSPYQIYTREDMTTSHRALKEIQTESPRGCFKNMLNHHIWYYWLKCMDLNGCPVTLYNIVTGHFPDLDKQG